MAEKIGQILIRKGKVTPAQLRDALRTQQFFGGYLGSHLINLGFIDEAVLGETLAEIYQVPFASYDSIRLARPEVIARVSASIAQRYRVIPLQIEANCIHLAMLNPRDQAAIKEVSSATGLSVTPWVAPEFRIIHALDKHYKIRRERLGAIAVPAWAEDPGAAAPAHARPGSRRDSQAAQLTAERAGDPRHVPARLATKSRPGSGPELGLDGHPIDALVMPDFGGNLDAPQPSEFSPRSLEEWIDAEEGFPPREASGAAGAQGAAAGGRGHPRSSAVDTDGALVGSRDGTSPAPGRGVPASVAAGEVLHHELRPGTFGEGAGALAGASIDQLCYAASAVETRDDLARELVAFMARSFKRVAAFAVKQDQLHGWTGGPGIDPGKLAGISLPMAASSIFAPARTARDVSLGPVPESAAHEGFYASLGDSPAPPAALIIPVLLRDRIVAILYADNITDPLGQVDLALWRKLGQIATLALEILILKTKLRDL